jgi:tRNA(Ile2) C34 agmatinyltransferase TiaS
MAKSSKRKPTSGRRPTVGHVRVVCPQCGKRVNVPAQLGQGQTGYPCPSCRVPISRALIEAETAAPTEVVTQAENMTADEEDGSDSA